ncbi:MAG: hypothetical protein QXT72_04110 [Candidatus Micrarchaeia archaeon]
MKLSFIIVSIFFILFIFSSQSLINAQNISISQENTLSDKKSILEYISKIVQYASRIFGLNSKELEKKVYVQITEQVKPAYSRLKRDVCILYPYGKVLFSPDEKIIIKSLDSNYRIVQLIVNNIPLHIRASDYVSIDNSLLKKFNKISIYYEARVDGKFFRNRIPIEDNFELVDLRSVDIVNKEFERSLSYSDPLERSLYRLSILTGLEAQMGEDFEFEYNLNNYRYEVQRLLKERLPSHLN